VAFRRLGIIEDQGGDAVLSQHRRQHPEVAGHVVAKQLDVQ
jgi:hypothetical protein